MSGPIEKFNLIKQWGKALRDAGYDPQAMSVEELKKAIAELQKREGNGHV